jgi:predicted MFS family arabinose efflux permease
VIVGGVTQIAAAALIGGAYMDHYSKAWVERSEVLATLARADIESALLEDVGLEDLDYRQFPWERLVSEDKLVASLEVRDATDKPVVRVDARGIVNFAKLPRGEPQSGDGSAMVNAEDYVSVADLSRRGEIGARVIARLPRQALDAHLIDLGVDGMATIMVSLIVLLEMLLVLSLLIQHRTVRAGSPDTDLCGRMRPAIFLFLFGIDLSMSFVPLHMGLLYEPVLGLSRDAVMALPISTEFLFVGIAILAGGVWFDRRQWRQPFSVGIILAGAGALYSWLAPDALHFIASRAVLGTGYGLTLMASQGFVISHSDGRSQTRAFARLFAGLYGGSISGSVTGAILAERIGFGPVFLVGALMVFLVLPYMAAVLPRKSTMPVAVKAPATERRVGSSPIVGFLGNRSALSLMLFSSLPASMAAIGFLYYFSPIYLNRLGASQSTIGQVLMLYGLCLVFLGPWVSRNIDTVERKRLAVIAGAILGGAAFLSFNALHGLLAATVAVVVLGVSHSLVFSSQSAYALTLKATRELGEGKAIGLLGSTGRVGQMLGPVAFGLIIVATDVERGLTYLGYAYLLMALMFWLFTRNDRQMLVG